MAPQMPFLRLDVLSAEVPAMASGLIRKYALSFELAHLPHGLVDLHFQ